MAIGSIGERCTGLVLGRSRGSECTSGRRWWQVVLSWLAIINVSWNRDCFRFGDVVKVLGDTLQGKLVSIYFGRGTMYWLHTALACAAFSSGDAFGSKVNAMAPAFLLSSTIFFSASAADTPLFGSWAASITPWVFNSAACDWVAMVVVRRTHH